MDNELVELYDFDSDFINLDDALNDAWVTEFEQTDQIYKDFYKENLYYTNLKFIYVNRSNEIDLIKTDTFLMSKPNFISHHEISQILKKNYIITNKEYLLMSIVKYNVTLDVDEVQKFLSLKDNHLNFLTDINNVGDIPFEETITMFHDLNDLVFIFCERNDHLKKKKKHNTTKKARANQDDRKI
ncbi:MAG: hypothetical protein MUP82_07345 [Candidatus Marinimicrobia bacterium]|nr:hypothetical protein [Candidatus Neomarinimicrobiota bacterium]